MSHSINMKCAMHLVWSAVYITWFTLRFRKLSMNLGNRKWQLPQFHHWRNRQYFMRFA